MATDLTIVVSEGPVKLTLFRAPGDAPRPSVLLLHGAQGFGPQMAEWRRYAGAIAIEGFDTYLVHYYNQVEYTALRTGQNLMATRLEAWVKLVSELATAVTRKTDATGKVGLVGFSNGGLLAVAASAADPRFDAAVIYYGGIPHRLKQIRHLPPLLILHGDADKIIPLAAGQNLAAVARKLEGSGEFVTYQGAAHGFATERSVAATDALARTITFLRKELNVKPPP